MLMSCALHHTLIVFGHRNLYFYLCFTAHENGANTPLKPNLKIRRQLKGHFGKVYAMHWAGNGTDLVSASQDGKLIVWNGMTNMKVIYKEIGDILFCLDTSILLH